MARRRIRTGSLVRVDQEQQTLEAPLETNPAVDPRPHAIGDQNLPGREAESIRLAALGLQPRVYAQIYATPRRGVYL